MKDERPWIFSVLWMFKMIRYAFTQEGKQGGTKSFSHLSLDLGALGLVGDAPRVHLKLHLDQDVREWWIKELFYLLTRGRDKIMLGITEPRGPLGHIKQQLVNHDPASIHLGYLFILRATRNTPAEFS